MLRRAAGKCFGALGHKLGAPLALVALSMLVLLPVVDERGVYVSESNLKPFASSLLAESDFDVLPYGLTNETLLVRGPRAAGGVLTTIVVNHDHALSVRIALALSAALRRRSFLSGDVAFVFFSDAANGITHMQHCKNDQEDDVEDGGAHATQRPMCSRFLSSREALDQVPSDVEVAIVLNVSHFFGTVCINIFGSDGLQPNMDVVNLAVMAAGVYGVQVDMLCQSRHLGVAGVVAAVQAAEWLPLSLRALLSGERAQRLVHYALSLLTAAAVDGDPSDGGGNLRRRGIHPIVLESPDVADPTNAGTVNRATPHSPMPLASVVEALLRGINNLDERLHHSFPIYIHTAARWFVDFEVAQHVIFIVLAALASDLYATVRSRQDNNQRAVQWGNDVVGLVVLVLCSMVWDNRTTSRLLAVELPLGAAPLLHTVGMDAATMVVAAQCLLTAATVLFLALRIKGDCILVAVWNCVAVCLVLACHPLLALIGSTGIAFVQVATRISATASLLIVTTLLYYGASTVIIIQATKDSRRSGGGVSSLFVVYALVLNAIWIASRWVRNALLVWR